MIQSVGPLNLTVGGVTVACERVEFHFPTQPVHEVNADPLAVAMVEAWARQPFREANYAALRDRLSDTDAPAAALAECDRLWRVACAAKAECPLRKGRLHWIRRHWGPGLRGAFLREELPF